MEITESQPTPRLGFGGGLLVGILLGLYVGIIFAVFKLNKCDLVHSPSRKRSERESVLIEEQKVAENIAMRVKWALEEIQSEGNIGVDSVKISEGYKKRFEELDKVFRKYYRDRRLDDIIK